MCNRVLSSGPAVSADGIALESYLVVYCDPSGRLCGLKSGLTSVCMSIVSLYTIYSGKGAAIEALQ